MRARQHTRWLVAVCLLPGLLNALMTPRAARADEKAQIISAAPALSGNLVVCHLTTDGLPGEKLLQSMRSGLVSEVDFDLALLDEKQRVIAGNHLSLRLAFDLWEEVFSVRAGDQETRFTELAGLVEFLNELREVPVAPASLLGEDQRYQLRIDLKVHPVAPDEADRVEDAIAGDQRPQREGLDRQEATISLGRLIRFFYKEGGRGGADAELVSGWFRRKELSDAAD